MAENIRTKEQQHRLNSPGTRGTEEHSGTVAARPLIHSDAAPGAIIVLQTAVVLGP